MGKVVGFSELPEYLSQLDKEGATFKATILDTNVLITSSYEVRDDFYDVVKVLDTLSGHGFRFFATVNTRAEFLEFHRRLILTENLLDSIDEHSKLKLPTHARAKIQSLKGSLKA